MAKKSRTKCRRLVHRSSKTGRFVPKSFAIRHPSTTEQQNVLVRVRDHHGDVTAKIRRAGWRLRKVC